MNRLELEKMNSICVLRCDHIGDLILTTPFLKALRQQAPTAKITLMVQPSAAGVLENADFIDKICVYDRAHSAQSLAELRATQPDLAICLSPRTLGYKMAKKSGAKIRVGYAYSCRPLTLLSCRCCWLTDVVVSHVEKTFSETGHIPHEVEQILTFAQAVGIDYQDQTLSLGLGSDNLEYGQRLAAQWGKPTLALHLHDKWLSHGWTIESLARLTESLLYTAGEGGVMVTFGPVETPLAQQLAHTLLNLGIPSTGLELPNSPSPGAEVKASHLHFCSNLSVQQWASVYQACSCLVTPDTGAVHVSAAVKTPVVDVFEPETADKCMQQWTPWQVPHHMLVKGAPQATIEAIISNVEQLLRQ